MGNVHEIAQGEGGEQGDPLMPLLFSLGQHRSLESISGRLRAIEKIMAYLDDVHVVCAHRSWKRNCSVTPTSASITGKNPSVEPWWSGTQWDRGTHARSSVSQSHGCRVEK